MRAAVARPDLWPLPAIVGGWHHPCLTHIFVTKNEKQDRPRPALCPAAASAAEGRCLQASGAPEGGPGPERVTGSGKGKSVGTPSVTRFKSVCDKRTRALEPSNRLVSPCDAYSEAYRYLMVMLILEPTRYQVLYVIPILR